MVGPIESFRQWRRYNKALKGSEDFRQMNRYGTALSLYILGGLTLLYVLGVISRLVLR